MKTMVHKAFSLLMLAGTLIACDADAQTSAASQTGVGPFGPAISVGREVPLRAKVKPENRIDQSSEAVRAKSIGCMDCHQGIEEMHASPNVMLGCTDCHGGNSTPGLKQAQAHVLPKNPLFWESSANPNDSTVLLNHE